MKNLYWVAQYHCGCSIAHADPARLPKTCDLHDGRKRIDDPFPQYLPRGIVYDDPPVQHTTPVLPLAQDTTNVVSLPAVQDWFGKYAVLLHEQASAEMAAILRGKKL